MIIFLLLSTSRVVVNLCPLILFVNLIFIRMMMIIHWLGNFIPTPVFKYFSLRVSNCPSLSSSSSYFIRHCIGCRHIENEKCTYILLFIRTCTWVPLRKTESILLLFTINLLRALHLSKVRNRSWVGFFCEHKKLLYI